MSGISSADIANATASSAVNALEDQRVMIEWLMDRVAWLETKLNVFPEPCPELPSARMQRASRAYFASLRKEEWKP